MGSVRRFVSGPARSGIAWPSACLVSALALASLVAAARAQQESAVPGPADVVVDVRVVGNESVPLHKIAPQIRTRAGRPFDAQQIEDDVRRLTKSRMFVNVTTTYQRLPEGVIVVFQVVERPTLRYVRYPGATLRRATLDKNSGIKVGDSIDPFAVDEARRRLEEYYHSKGFAKCRVTTLEGNKPGDRGAVFLVNEGPKQKIFDIEFEGNTIADDARLKTQIDSKPPMFYLFGGGVDPEKIDGDVDKLTAYYRSLGFFSAKISRELEFGENNAWATLRFVINEGPRYKVRSVSVVGAKQFAASDLENELQLKGGKFFDQGAMTRDLAKLQDKYGGIGFVYSNIQADPRFLEQPGELDLVYQVEEGDRYRVGRIDVRIEGDNPHTRLNTVLNRVDLRPGDIVDTRKIRDSERRLQASGLFLTDRAQGIMPRITWSAPEPVETIARQPTSGGDGSAGGTIRGQSPDGAARVADRPQDGVGEAGSRNLVSPNTWPAQDLEIGRGNPFLDREVDENERGAGAATGPESFDPPMPMSASPQGVPEPPPPAEGKLIIRGQSPLQPPSYLGGSSASTPAVGQVPMGAVAPGSQVNNSAGYGTAGGSGGVVQTQYSQPAPTAPAPSNGAVGGQPGLVGVPPGTFTNPPTASPYGPPAAATTAPPIGGYGSGNEIFGQPPAYYNPEPPTRDLILTPTVQEAQTGRFMLGVGVNSNAGLLGSIVLDEQNADLTRLPTSWRDVIEGRAFRGAGQQVRLEAVPGNQVSRYTFIFRQPYLFDTRVQFSGSGYYFQRYYNNWFEDRAGGRIQLGYQLPYVPDLSFSGALRMENVGISDPSTPGPVPAQLSSVLGDNGLYVAEFAAVHDTRDSTFLATQGHRVLLGFDLGFGDYDFPRGTFEARKHFLLNERPDGSGRQVLTVLTQLGITGSQTPIFENYFVGGFSSMRGFNFRGVGPYVNGMNVGGHFQWLNTVEYMFSLTADDMIRGVTFVDFGTVEESFEMHGSNFRVSPGVGLRITVPAMGPAPIALDFAVPVHHGPGDDIQNFAFYVGFGR